MSRFLSSLPWLFKMAWRDSRKQRSRLLLFLSSIALGIAALVAINSFSDNLEQEIGNQSKTLLGADLAIDSPNEWTEEVTKIMDGIDGERAKETDLVSMLRFLKTDDTRLVQVRALEGNYPFYGQLQTEPAKASAEFQTNGSILVDQNLMLAFNAQIGDEVKLGEATFTIGGEIIRSPGGSGLSASISPPIYIPHKTLAATELVRPGSMSFNREFFKLNNPEDLPAITAQLEKLKTERMDFETVESRTKNLQSVFSFMNSFLNLVAFVALLLGCIGVASSVQIYLKGKQKSIAILRSLGVDRSQAFSIYFIQILSMGIIGSLIGALLGVSIQRIIPAVFADFLPLEVQVVTSWSSMFKGWFTGLVISILFALIPLVDVRRYSPLLSLRSGFNGGSNLYPAKIAVYLVVVIAIWLFAAWQMNSFWNAMIFTVGLLISFALLTLAAWLLMKAMRKFLPKGWSFSFRQGLSNLYRPQNQTQILILTIGLGTAMLATLFFMQDLLLSRVAFAGSSDRPNIIAFDIQTEQRGGMAKIAEQQNLPVIAQVPIVTAKIASINGESVDDMAIDTTKSRRRGLNRENRVTFRDTLIDSETLVEGIFENPVSNPDDTIFVSISERFQQFVKMEVGDHVVWNVQGTMIPTYVGSMRKIDWARLQTNFLVVFPSGVLEEAPQFHVLLSRAETQQASANFQREVVKAYPNVSVVDLSLVMSTVDDILSKVSFVIQFMALFSILTGLIVLIGSVLISKLQRIKETVLLKTLGAERARLIKITAIEYTLLGLTASLAGVGIALFATWALAKYSFDINFVPKLIPIAMTVLVVTFSVTLVGTLNIRDILRRSPLEVLREEEGNG